MFIVFSCQQSESIIEPEPEMIAENFTGEEIFRGIFFYQGDIIENFDSIQKDKETIETTFDANPEAELVYKEFVDQIIEKIKIIDPDYFEKFKIKISTDNLYQVEQVLNSAKSIIRDAGQLTDDKNMFELSDELEEKEVVIDENVFDPSASKNSNYYALRGYLNDKYNISLAEHGFGDAQACCLLGVCRCRNVGCGPRTAC